MVLVFGGSFNPPTIAHEAIIHKLYVTFKPEKIIIMPNGNYFSWKTDLIDFKHRFKMMTLMTNDLSYVIVSNLEDTKNFLGSYHTLTHLSQTYEDLHFVVGADHIRTLDQWKNYEKLIKTYKFVILTRTGYKVDESLLNTLGVTYTILNFDSNISSTKVRNDLINNLDSLNPKVKDYILKNELYKEVKR